MSALTKTLLLIICLLLLLIGGVLAYLNFFFDPNDYKEDIKRLAQTHSGLQLSLDGPIEWSLFPWLGLGLNQVSARLPQQPDKPFAAVELARLRVKVVPLLTGRIELGALQLDGLQLNLEKDAQGRGNWEQLTAAKPTPTQAPASDTTSDATAPVPAIDLAVAQVTIQDSQLHYTDRQSGQRVSLSQLNASSRDINLERAFPLQLSFSVANREPQLRAAIELDAQVQLDLPAQRYQLSQLQLQSRLTSPLLGTAPLNVKLQGDLRADLQQAQAAIDRLQVQAANAQLQGQLKVQDFNQAPRFQGQLTLADFNPRQLLEQLGRELPVTASPQALTRAGLRTRIGGPANTLQLQDLQLLLDNTRLIGQLSARLDNGALRFELNGDQLNLDDYLPPPRDAKEEDAQETDAPAPDAPATEPELLPVDTLRGLDLAGRFQLQRLIAQGLTLEQLDLQLMARNGVLQLERANAQLYEGRYVSSARIDLNQQPIRHQFSHQLQDVQALPLLRDLADAELLQGRLQLSGDYRTQGNTLSRLLKQLNGDARFQVDDGALRQFNLSRQLCSAIALVNKEPLENRQWDADTRFSQLKGTLQIRNGIAHNRDLTISTPALTLTGEGRVDLTASTLDYSLGAQLTGDAERHACRVNKKLQQVRWLVRCKGAFTDAPASLCKFDDRSVRRTLEEIAKAELEAKAQKELERQKEKLLENEKAQELERKKQQLLEQQKAEELKQKAEEELKSKLKGLFN